MNNINLSLIVITLTIYAIRLVPFIFLRKPIKNRWFNSFLYYVPYVTLAVMTFPAIITGASVPAAGIAALVVGLIIAWFWGDLFAVAISCCVTALLVGMIV